MKSIRKINQAFTLVEVMVSSALIVVIMGFLMYTMDQTQRTMKGADSKVNQFQNARVAFEAMTRNLSQATLNTFWDVDFGDVNGKLEPRGYRRNSDLHFVSGKASQSKILNSREEINPTHGVFFQAPLGVSYQEEKKILTSGGYKEDPDYKDTAVVGTSESKRKYRYLNGMMNVCGYYIHWDEDPRVPTFIKDAYQSDKLAKRHRYRLMEVVQPAETVSIYNNPWYTKPGGQTDKNRANFKANPTSDGAISTSYLLATDWIKVAVGKLKPTMGTSVNYSRPLADNIVAMVITPKLPEGDRGSKDRLDDISKNFEYDSRPQKVYDATIGTSNPSFIKGTAQLTTLLNDADPANPMEFTQYAQLPPILQVTLVAIDEDSGAKLEASIDAPENGPGKHWANGLFEQLTTEENFIEEIGSPSRPESDSLIGRLAGKDNSLGLPKMNYRIFRTDVVMRSAKWSNPKSAQ